MWITVTIGLFLILSFAGGLTMFRQTKAIWSMTSDNAISINNTLNSIPTIEPLLVLIVAIVAAAALVTSNKGFG